MVFRLNGGAAFGPDVTMTWNDFIRALGASITSLKNSKGTVTAVSITDGNAGSYWDNANMFTALVYGNKIMNNYHHNNNSGNKVMTIAGLAANCWYDLYLYGHGNAEDQNTRFTIGSVSKDCTIPVVGLTTLTEGAHYVVFRGVTANSSGQITVTWGPASGTGYAAINAVQIVQRLYGDINGDSSINSADLDLFVDCWLGNSSSLDLNGDGSITLYEFSQFAGNWLETY
jgi:hypothetical protein